MAAVFEGRVHFLRLGRAAGLPAARDEPRPGADLAALRRLDGHLLGRLARLHLPAHPDPGVAAAQPPALRRGAPGAQLQHGRVVRHQHQLAELRRRDDHVVLLPDRRAHGPAVRERRPSGSPWPSPWSAGSPGATRRPSGTSGSTSPAACSTSCSRSPSSPASSSSARARCRPWPGRSPSTTR